MINVMIISENISKSRRLVNAITRKNPDIRMFIIAMKRDDAIKFMKKEKMDIVILNINEKDIENKIIERFEIEKYKNSVIVYSETKNNIEKLINNPHIYSYINKDGGILKVLNKVKELYDVKINECNDENIQNSIGREMSNLGFNMGHNGSKYILEAIHLLFKDKKVNNLSKDIYPIIAERHHKSLVNIKTNIAKATDYMYYECEENELMNYFDLKQPRKPRPKEIISTILRKLNKEY